MWVNGGVTSLSESQRPLSGDELARVQIWWRAANYLSVGQIYLLANPLLREPLAAEQVKPRLLGHWGTTPGLNFVYAHMNRAIRAARSCRRRRGQSMRPASSATRCFTLTAPYWTTRNEWASGDAELTAIGSRAATLALRARGPRDRAPGARSARRGKTEQGRTTDRSCGRMPMRRPGFATRQRGSGAGSGRSLSARPRARALRAHLRRYASSVLI